MMERIFSKQAITIFLFALVQASCDKPVPTKSPPASPESTTPTVSYPLERVIRDLKGRPLDGLIIGKTPGQIYFVRTSDGGEFKIPINSLGVSDQEFAERLPLQLPPSNFQQVQRETPTLTKKGEPPYVVTRRESIKRIQEKIDLLKQELNSTSNQMVQRAKNSQIDRHLEEIGKLEAAIMRYLQEND